MSLGSPLFHLGDAQILLLLDGMLFLDRRVLSVDPFQNGDCVGLRRAVSAFHNLTCKRSRGREVGPW